MTSRSRWPRGFGIVGGSDASVVVLEGGRANQFTNHGEVWSLDGEAGTAVLATSGGDTIENHGLLIGSVDLGRGANTLVNHAAARFDAGATIHVGAGNVFGNAGFLSPGGAGLVRTSAVTGDFEQTGSPHWLVDFGAIGVNDALTVSGQARLGASATLVDLNALEIPTGSGIYPLLTATGGVTGGSLGLGTFFGSTMPVGRTFELERTATQAQLTLTPSTGAFHFAGGAGSTWISPFVDGISNWRRPSGAQVYGTPGAGADVVVSGSASADLGADFSVNSLTFRGSGSGQAPVSLCGTHAHDRGSPRDRSRRRQRQSGGDARRRSRAAAGPALDERQHGAAPGWPVARCAGAGSISRWAALVTRGSTPRSPSAPVRSRRRGSGVLTLTGANTYSGGTLVEDGWLVGHTTSLQGAIVNHGLTLFDQLTDGTYAGAMTGTGGLIKVGPGLLRLTGANGYTGGTLVAEGGLVGSAVSLVGDIQIDDGATTEFAQPITGTFAGRLAGAGTVRKTGGGTLWMTGDSSRFAGHTALHTGGLTVTGWLGGAIHPRPSHQAGRHRRRRRRDGVGRRHHRPGHVDRDAPVERRRHARAGRALRGRGERRRSERSSSGCRERWPWPMPTSTWRPDTDADFLPITSSTIALAGDHVDGAFAGVTSSLGVLDSLRPVRGALDRADPPPQRRRLPDERHAGQRDRRRGDAQRRSWPRPPAPPPCC